MIVEFIDEHRSTFGVEPICEVLQVAPSTYHAAKARPVSERAARHAALKVRILETWTANYEVYGVYKMWKALRRGGVDVGRDQVAARMRELGISGARRGGAKVYTTRPDGSGRPPDLVKRRFVAAAPNELWVTDLERHEALSNRAVVKGHRLLLVAASGQKLRAA